MALNNPSSRQRLWKCCVILAIAVCSAIIFCCLIEITRELGDDGGMLEEWINGPPSPVDDHTKNATLLRDDDEGINSIRDDHEKVGMHHQQLKGTAVVQLWGELGNHLSILAFYFALRTIASTEFNVSLTLHVRSQNNGKASRAAQNAKCLKSFRDLDFDECTWSNNSTKGQMCANKISNQLGAIHDRAGMNVTLHQLGNDLQMGGSTSASLRSTLRSYVAILTDSTILELFRSKDLGWSTTEPYPFLFLTDRLHVSKELLNEFYSKGLPEYFAFDHTTKMNDGCCALMPKRDEHVFHYRSFVYDLPQKHMAWGGAELRPAYAANLLAANVPPGSNVNVAIVSGRSHKKRLEEYKTAFENQSFKARIITDQTAVQDFCFLAHANYLWGTERSTYIQWASLIGGHNLRNATLYGVNYPARENNITLRAPTNVELAKIVHHPVFEVSDEDVW